jgi:hypothetical protein
MISYEITENKNLLLYVTDSKAFREVIDKRDDDDAYGWVEAWADALEHATGNGLCHVRPEQIGALTDAPILTDGSPSDDGSTIEPADANIWWWPQYEGTDPLDELFNNGRIVLTNGGKS